MNKFQKNTSSNWKSIFVLLLCFFTIVLSVLSLILSQRQNLRITEIEQKIDNYFNDDSSIDLKTNAYLEFCESINNRADNIFNEIITIVGVFASVITLLGILITFKAPKDIEKDIAELHDLLAETKLLEENQEYLLDISDAIKEKTIYHRIKALDELIKKHPDKWQAYLYRGCEYDDKKEYDKAISDYKLAKNFGCDEETYCNNMSVSLSKKAKITKNKFDQMQSLEYISKSIEMNPEESMYYSNRGGIYSEMKAYDKALSDYDKALSLDPKNYEAYTNKAILYMELTDNSNSNDLCKTYRKKAIECVKNAIKLNFEDSSNLKRLDKLLKNDLVNKESNSIDNENYKTVNNLLFDINDKMGDIESNQNNHIEAISHYTNALVCFNVPSRKLIESNLELIDKICNKIFACKAQMPSVDMSESINRKLQILIIVINDMAYDYYKNKEFSVAGKLFEYTTILSGYGSSASNNLAYMIRRKEYSSERFELKDLLCCKTPDETSSFLRINRALCFLTGVGFNKSVENALKEINICECDLENAANWWSDEDNAGSAESNIVLLLLLLMDKIELNNNYDIEKMINQADSDGYDLPSNLIEIVNQILSKDD